MADNLFMSDYQKIIFANNINENNIKDLGGYGNGKSINDIVSLSTAYPFVVFVTDCKNGAINDRISYTNLPDDGIRNIWVNGIRATRFVGVDPNSSITIGDRTIKLHFDYDTGLLSFKDANQLKAIKLVRCTYIKANQYNYNAGSSLYGEERSIDCNSNNINISINAVDNKFKLIFEFEVEEGANIDVISKGLNIKSIQTTDNHFNIISGPKHITGNGLSNTSTKKCYAYECQIVYDTERMTSDYSYNAISQYDSTIKFPITNGFGLNLRLNPVNYDIILEETGAKVINNIDLKANREYVFNVNIYPNGNTQYTYPIEDSNKELRFIVESGNTNYVTITNNQEQSILSNNISFTIQTNNTTNSIVPINLKLKNHSWADDFTYNLIKSFNINLGGGTVYFYCGYDVPEDTDAFKSKMHDITNNINNKDLNPLYDWKNNNWGVTYDDASKYFYIAFTTGYENVICSCWDCYVTSGSYKKYMPIGTNANGTLKDDNNNNGRFVKQNNISGISVYKGSVTGKFFGKIQIQNN